MVNIGPLLLFPLFSPTLLQVLFDFVRGDEAHGVRECIVVTGKEADLEEMWMEHGVVLSFLR
jgi:hypothetical protein